MKLAIDMSLDNAAFEDDWGAEAARILDGLVARLPFKVADGVTEGRLIDRNGNTIGTWEVTDG